MFPCQYEGVSDPLWFGSSLLPLGGLSGTLGWLLWPQVGTGSVQTDITNRKTSGEDRAGRREAWKETTSKRASLQ